MRSSCATAIPTPRRRKNSWPESPGYANIASVESSEADMRRREALGVLSAVAVWPLAGRARAEERIARIGWLDPLPAGGSGYDELLASLSDLGWVEGKTLHIEAR